MRSVPDALRSAVAGAIKPWPKKTVAANGARFVAGDCRAVLQLFRFRFRLHLGHVGFGIGTVFGVGDEAIAVAVHGREVEAGVGAGLGRADLAVDIGVERSEEHTSELQSLMRISYAAFCLKKKKLKSRDPHRTK